MSAQAAITLIGKFSAPSSGRPTSEAKYLRVTKNDFRYSLRELLNFMWLENKQRTGIILFLLTMERVSVTITFWLNLLNKNRHQNKCNVRANSKLSTKKKLRMTGLAFKIKQQKNQQLDKWYY